MRTIFLTILTFCFFTASAQQPGKAYYNYTVGGLMGGSITLLIPEGNQMILQRSNLGFLGNTYTDTLNSAPEGFSSERVTVTFTEKGVVVQSKASAKQAKPKKYKEYDASDPFIIESRNSHYESKLSYEADKMANEKISRFNEEWQAGSYLLSTRLNSIQNGSRPTSLYSHSEFKAVADSIHLLKLELISNILAKKQQRKESIIAERASITTASIIQLLPELDHCRTDQELFIFLAEKEPLKLMEAIEALFAGNDRPWYQVTFEPSLPIYFLPKDLDVALAKQSLLFIPHQSKSVKKMKEKIEKYWH